MKKKEFWKGICQSLERFGFDKQGDLLKMMGDEIVIVAGVQKGFGEQLFVNIGFCIKRLGLKQVIRVEQADMYFRLERVFPQYREIILAAGDLADPAQLEAYEAFLKLMDGEVGEGLKALGSERGLIDAYRIGRLSEGLVTEAAQALISNSSYSSSIQ